MLVYQTIYDAQTTAFQFKESVNFGVFQVPLALKLTVVGFNSGSVKLSCLKARLHWRFLLRFRGNFTAISLRFQIARANYWRFHCDLNRQ